MEFIKEGGLIKMKWASPTSINSSRGIVAILEYTNTVTNFWMSRMLMVAIFVIFLMGYLRSSKDEDFLGAFAVGSFATFIIGILFWIIGFVDGKTFGMIIALTIISTALLMFDKRGQ